jgi:TolA-binding protein
VLIGALTTPEQALQGIADLRRQGRHDEADKALAEFRQRYPDYKIPPEMLEKVERR